MMSPVSSPDNPDVIYLQILWYPLLSNEGLSVWSVGDISSWPIRPMHVIWVTNHWPAWVTPGSITPLQVTMSPVITNTLHPSSPFSPLPTRCARSWSWEKSNYGKSFLLIWKLFYINGLMVVEFMDTDVQTLSVCFCDFFAHFSVTSNSRGVGNKCVYCKLGWLGYWDMFLHYPSGGPR